MNTVEPKVEVATGSNLKHQFGNEGPAKKNFHQRFKHWGWLCAVAAMVVVIVLVGAPEDVSHTEPAKEISIPSDSGNAASAIDLTSYSRVEEDTLLGRRPKVVAGKKEVFRGPQLLMRPKNVKIPPGVFVEAKLLTGASNGTVKAEVTEPVVVAGEYLVPAKTVIIGTGTSTEKRLLIRFSKLVFRDGFVTNVQAEAADLSDKIPGIKGSLLGYYSLKTAGSLGLNFLSGVTEGLQETEGQEGVVVKKATLKNALLNGATKTSVQESQELLSEVKNTAPIIEIDEGETFFIHFLGDEGT